MLAPSPRRTNLTLIGAVALVLTIANPAAAPPGDLDPTFDGDGKVTTNFAGGDTARAVALQSDGKIVTAGGVSNANDFAVARYNTDGSLDTTFDGDGKVTTDFAGAADIAFAVALQGDGRIVAAGCFNWAPCTDFALARYNTDGSLDSTFDGDGKVTTNFAGSNDTAAFDVAIQGDGKIVAAGWARDPGYQFALIRYNVDGSLDSTFDLDGKVTTDFAGGNDRGFDVTIQGDGKIVAAGEAVVSGPPDFAVARYNGDGSLETTFDGDGKVTTDFAGGYDRVEGVALQGDGKIVTAGFAAISGTNDFALARYNADGSLDTIFGGDGKVTTDFGGSTDQAFAMTIQANGRILAAGAAFVSPNFDFGLARYLPDADADLSITKSGPAGRAPTGRNMTYTLTVTNHGPDSASGVTVTDQLPSSVTFVSASANQGSCGESNGTVFCTLGEMSSGAIVTIEIVVRPTTAGMITNSASVASPTPDSNLGNNSDSEDTSVCRITSRRSSIPCG